MTALIFMMLLTALRHCAGSNDYPENVYLSTDLMDHQVLVLRVPHGEVPPVNVPLTCGEAYNDSNVFWKKDDKASPDLRGNHVTVEVQDFLGGNYSCHLDHQNGPYLNHTLVLVQLDPDNTSDILQKHPPHHRHTGEYIQCSGHNYNGSFHCSWKRTAWRPEATVLLVKAEQNSTAISCVQDTDGSGMTCTYNNCSYEEEKHRISVTVYIYNIFKLEAYTTPPFFLRDIVRPEPVEQLRVEAGGEAGGVVFHWEYPASWEKPCTFYGLVFQVKLVHHGENCHFKHMINIQPEIIDKTTHTVSVKKRYVFCVRAKDKHTEEGPWSNWSHYEMKKHKHH